MSVAQILGIRILARNAEFAVAAEVVRPSRRIGRAVHGDVCTTGAQIDRSGFYDEPAASEDRCIRASADSEKKVRRSAGIEVTIRDVERGNDSRAA
jgi:hypothetical protein